MLASLRACGMNEYAYNPSANIRREYECHSITICQRYLICLRTICLLKRKIMEARNTSSVYVLFGSPLSEDGAFIYPW